MKGVIAGCGHFAQFHAEGWQRVSGVSISAVADLIPGRAREFASRWSIPASYSDIEEMLEREKPDFVDIITRPDTHFALTSLAATRGVHVICQKPMAPSLDESREMVRVCADAGVRLIVHENWRWQHWYREIRGLVEAGVVGRTYHLGVRMRTGDGRGDAPYSVQPYFREMPRLLIFETLVHYLDTFRYLEGEIESVYCSTARLNPAIVGEDYALISVRFNSGAQGTIDANRISGPVPPKVAFGDFYLEGDRAAIRMTPDGAIFVIDYLGEEAMHPYEQPSAGYRGDSVRALQQHIVNCLRDGSSAESEGEDYLKTVSLVEACYKSAASGELLYLRESLH